MDTQNVRIGNRDLKELLVLIVATIVVVVTVVPLTSMLIRAWDGEGIGYRFITYITTSTPFSLESIVVLPLGIVLGLLCVFALDRTKYIQALLLTIAVGPLLGTIWYFGFWFDGRIDWVTNIPYGIVGILIGIAIGTADKTLATISEFDALGIGRREFPVAAWALFVILIQLTTVGLIDAILYSEVSDFEKMVDVVVAISFVGLVGFFIQYRDRHDVGLVSPDRSAETVVVCGLYDYLSERYRTVVSEGSDALNRLSSNLSAGNSVSVATERMVFDIHTEGWFDNWTTIATAGYEQRQLLDSQLERIASSEDKKGISDSNSWQLFRNMIIPNKPVDFVDRLLTFDTVLLVVPLDHPAVQQAFDPNKESENIESVEFVDRYRRFIEVTNGGELNVVIVATSGDVAINYYTERYGETQINTNELRIETQDRLKLLCENRDEEEPFPATPIIVAKNSESEVGPSLLGVDSLWDSIIQS